ncbi:hypothetical protein IX51_06145 [uncultured archaeon]|nr:hypothetical protein IX51_06145 [uncultured archaeon]
MAIVLAFVVGGLGVASAATVHSGSGITHLIPTGSGDGSSVQDHNGSADLNEQGDLNETSNTSETQEFEGQDSIAL